MVRFIMLLLKVVNFYDTLFVVNHGLVLPMHSITTCRLCSIGQTNVAAIQRTTFWLHSTDDTRHFFSC